MTRKLRNTYLFVIMVACLVMALSTGLVWAGSLEPPASAMDESGNPVPTTMEPSEALKLQPIDDGDIRFVNLRDGRVLDNRTGLEWEQSPDGTFGNHADALTRCEGLTLGGHDDWQLPERDELASLIDLDNLGDNPALPLKHPFIDAKSNNYWSATSFVADPSFAWIVDFGTGVVVESNKGSNSVVWCVRGSMNADAY